MLIWSLFAHGQASLFLFGFMTAGSVLLFAYLAVSILVPHTIDRYARVPASALARGPVALANSFFPELLEQAIRNAALMIVLGVPLILLALFGGWLNEKLFRITLSIQPRAVPAAAATDSPSAA